MMRISRNSKGFTLIELLIVVAIIGILAAIAIPAYSGYTKKARLAGVVHAMGAVKNAICAYYTEAANGVIPDAANVGAIGDLYGVRPTTPYTSAFTVAGGAAGVATITATPNITGITGNLVLSTADMGTWSWATSTVGSEYMPKD
jgi:type IV pilus assembly protein PilA